MKSFPCGMVTSFDVFAEALVGASAETAARCLPGSASFCLDLIWERNSGVLDSAPASFLALI